MGVSGVMNVLDLVRMHAHALAVGQEMWCKVLNQSAGRLFVVVLLMALAAAPQQQHYGMSQAHHNDGQPRGHYPHV